MVVAHSATLFQLTGATLPVALLQHYCFSHTEEQLVARKHLSTVYPVLDIRYCGVLPIHTAKQTAVCVTSL